MNVYALVHRRVLVALQALQGEGALPAGLDFANVEVSPPREAARGDLACNAALVLAKAANMKPRDIADKLAKKLAGAADVASIEVAGPGFLNLSFAPAFWQGVVAAILGEGAAYGRADLGRGERVNVEYVSANPTGPMHVGHTRGAVFGDALANLLEFTGHTVTREFYINDAGAQITALARSAHLRYREALGEAIGEIPAGLYPGDYLVPVGRELFKRYGTSLRDKPESEWLPIVRDFAVARMMDLIRDDLAALGIEHEIFFSERSLHEPQPDGRPSKIAETIDFLDKQGLLYRGTLPPPKGKTIEDWEPRELLLFRATAFGDDVDRPVLKSDGTPAYVTPDIAYHREMFMRGFANMIIVLGADHTGYVRRLQAAVAAASGGKATIDVKICQLVKLFRAGEPVRMSKRAGTFVTLREVVDEVGRDAVRYMMLYRKNDAPLDFDLAKVVEQSKDNPVFYVQYAHARAKSVFRNAAEVFPSLTEQAAEVRNADLALLRDAGEIELIKKLAFFPVLVEGAARAHEPHRLAFYLYELASIFHTQWSAGNELPHLRFIQGSDGSLTASRLALIRATAQVLASGLGILGVHAPDEMR